MLIEARSKVVMMGDSVTDAECGKPAGEGLFDPYGKGYVAFVNALLGTHFPERRIRVVNKGRSGNNVRDLANRWQEDALNPKPDWVSLMIGINDVWRQFDMPLVAEAHVDLPEYEAKLTELVERTLPTVKGMVLMTPYYIEGNRQDAMRARMDEYGAVVKRLAATFQTVLVDTQAAFDAHLRHYHANALAWDRVHPNNTGHMILASAWLRAVGFQWQG